MSDGHTLFEGGRAYQPAPPRSVRESGRRERPFARKRLLAATIGPPPAAQCLT